jgi:hypothetical protein
MDVMILIPLAAVVIEAAISTGYVIWTMPAAVGVSSGSVTVRRARVACVLVCEFQICCGAIGLALFALTKAHLVGAAQSGMPALVASVALWPGLAILFLRLIAFPNQIYGLTKGGGPIAGKAVLLWIIRVMSALAIALCLMMEYIMLSDLTCSP